ncbi:ras-related protein [Anaeramoeba ignava]|uniref:Ras-related protein n=1 Tax=Anaeramoeba ignava TaxID=1746090 RepID=A0A9Q0LRQ4_ANAIG|nr:ras-related protein [Anaeramoeba ignava]
MAEVKETERRLAFKFVMIGSHAVGKTNILLRFCDKNFNFNIKPTIGVDFKTKEVQFDGKFISAQIWDTAGQERFQKALTQKESAKENAIVMILGNKCDLEQTRQVSKEMGENFAKENNLLFLETSAKDGTNIQNAFQTMIAEVHNAFIQQKEDLQQEKEQEQQKQKQKQKHKVILKNSKKPKKKRRWC